MRIIFAGTPEFAAETLQALVRTEHEVCAVYTQPDRPAGRGRKLTPSAVKQVAQLHNIPVEQPVNFKSDEAKTTLSHYNADLMVVVAYGLLLPQVVLDTPKLGCINIHASLLPKWRGAAPIQRALLAGDNQTGICIMQMEAGLDTGPVLSRSECDILESDTTQTLHDRLAKLGADTLLSTLNDLQSLQTTATEQDHDSSCYAAKLRKDEADIDWNQSAVVINRQIRAFNPWPIAQTLWQGNIFRIWQADVIYQTSDAIAGTVTAISKHTLDIATGEGTLRLKQVQVPGKRAMAITDFLNSNTLEIGQKLG
jgi:methionyl-tRNA formyltransferase